MSSSGRATRQEKFHQHMCAGLSADELLFSAEHGPSNNECFGATPVALCLDDTCDSIDSVHQFLMMGSNGIGEAEALPNSPGQESTHSSRSTQLDDEENDDDDENELMMLGGTSSYDRPTRTRPPSPRRPIAVAIPFRSTASVPVAAMAADAAAASTSRRSKKRQTDGQQRQHHHRPAAFFSPSSNCSSSCSSDDEHLAQPPDEEESLKRRRVAVPLGDASNLPPIENLVTQLKKPSLLGRCMSASSCQLDWSESDASSARIDNAIASIDSLNLIGNSEQAHSLPTVKSSDYGIRSVTPDTLARLLAGEFADSVANDYVIVDCRYPFEYDGGHVRGAVNLYRPEELLARLLPASATTISSHQTVIIFHCEFSSQRAPRMARLLRQRDREINHYPQLHYPEIYVLQGGYKAFYEGHKAYCEPLGYTRMSDPAFAQQLIQFDKLGRAWERQNSRSKHRQLQRLAGSPQLT